uniref:NTR domain-containing protein n=1 Tax=Strongyloides stercoralis TaxID=6248 RepID=A0A0K0DV35_STRER
MKVLQIKLFFLLFLLQPTNSQFTENCYCSYYPDYVSFCYMDWISHIKIDNRSVIENANISNRTPEGMDIVKYYVQHLNVLKKSKTYANLTLPNVIITSVDFNECGLSWLKEGEEYILSGLVMPSKEALFITYCDGLRFNGNINDVYGKIKLWNEIIPCPECSQ